MTTAFTTLSSRSFVAPLAAGAVVLTGVLAGCSSKDAAGEKVAVTATDSTCEVARSELSNGKTTFAVSNNGNDVTEVYVYAEGNRIMGEVENVGPGTSRDFTVELGGGSYEVACKPGMRGDGIRATVSVSGPTTTLAVPDRTITMDAFDYSYTGLDGFTVAQGETIQFVMTNTAPAMQHEFEVMKPDGNALGEIGPTDPGQTGSVVLTFDKAGNYRYICGIDDHEAKGMKGEFTVTSRE